jgi:putative nucleotidyltransferase with HDIG domain
MHLEITHMRSRVNRRTLALLLVCGLTPAIVMTGAAYYMVSTHLIRTAGDQLIETTRADAQLVGRRLQGMATALRRPIDSIPLTHGNVVFSQERRELQGYFDAVMSQSADGAVSKVRGSIPSPRELTPEQVSALRRGQAVTFLSESSDPAAFLMVTAAGKPGADFPRTWGLARFRGALTGLDESSTGGGFCVYARGAPLHCRADADYAPIPAGIAVESGRLRWKSNGAELTSAYARVARDSASDAEPWYVVRTAPEATALVPLAGPRSGFALGLTFVAGCLVLIGYLIAQRRSGSLAAVTLASEQLRSGDYSARLDEGANPEFETVTASFNQMAAELDRHAVTAEGLQRVADAVLVERSTATLITSVSSHLPALLNATAVTIAAAASDDPLHWRGEVTSHNRATSDPIDLIVTKATIGTLRLAPEWSVIPAGDPLPEYCSGLNPQRGAAVVVFPLLRSGRPFGVLATAQLPGVMPHPRLLASGRQFATQLARGLVNVAILEDLELQSIGTLTALARSIDASSRWTKGHSERVARMAVEIARRVGLDEKAQTLLRRGALVHDIGKLGLPSTILDRPGQLTDEEQATIETHPVIGAEMILMIPAFREVLPLVQHHHELLDGSGYPHGLRAEKIPPTVRILTVADVYDALISDRPYREGMTPEGALGILRRSVGVKFDDRVVDALEAILEPLIQRSNAGSSVEALTGHTDATTVLAEVHQVG